MSFVHLHVHSCYSLLDGAIKIPELVEAAAAMGMPAVALTDHGQMLGLWSFYKTAKAKGVKPILGVEAYVARQGRKSRDPSEKRFHLTLLAQDLTGYRNLCRLISLANMEGFYYKPRIDLEILEECAQGLVALSGCLQGEIPQAILSNRPEEARAAAERYARILPGRFYLELQENGIAEQALANQALVEMARSMGLPVAATNDCHYLLREHAKAHDVLLCIQTGKTLGDAKRMRMPTDQFFFKSPDEMRADFAWCPEAVDNVLDLAARCEVTFPKKQNFFPNLPEAEGLAHDERLGKQAREGLRRRFDKAASLGRPFADELRREYEARLETEIAVINSMGFPGYFLIVADFINWAKKKGIPVGPGRGSAVGSLAAWALEITDVDPIRYDLLFERFLNPERVSLPDIDVDFCAEGRAEVIKYVTDLYGGPEYVSQVLTLGQMKAKAVVRDVGRALGRHYAEVDAIAKMIPRHDISLVEAFSQVPALKSLAESDPMVGELMGYAFFLENLPRHTSIHASGLVIGDRPLQDHLPLCCDPKVPEIDGRRTQVVTQYDYNAVAENGLIKFDFLGLKTLTIIRNCQRLLALRGIKADMADLDYEDPATYELLTRGDVNGVFQLESKGIRNVLTRLKPSCLEDVIALVALYRPGPIKSGMIDDFIRIKHGQQEPHYDLDALKPILGETLGVIVYQEQVMRIAQVMASYSLGEADLLRRAMGKKNPAEMAAQKVRFLEGAAANGFPPDKAERIFDLMYNFADYGFNKSHSAAYAVIIYQTAWLKAHYPREFMAALMTSERDDQEKISRLIKECRQNGFPTLPPDVNSSELDFSVAGGAIIFGLGAIKGLGQTAIEAVLKARLEKPFEDLFDFCRRVGSQKVNRRVVEALIKCGAFDRCGGQDRAVLLAAVDEALEQGARSRQKKASQAPSLFAGLAPPPKLARVWPAATPLTDVERLNMEKDLLGFYVSGHPLARYEAAMAAIGSLGVAQAKRSRGVGRLRLCGQLAGVDHRTTKTGKPFAFASLEDSEGAVGLILWNNVLTKAGGAVENDKLVVIDGVLDDNDSKFGPKIVVSSVVELHEALEKMFRSVTFEVSLDDLQPVQDFICGQLGESGQAAVYLSIDDGLGKSVYRLDDQLKLSVGFFEEAGRALKPHVSEAISCSERHNPYADAQTD
ncbi:MAG: DNA polymerase III subunit alpha [Deltaproteobacteria bacterium]|nr:DNA polymerase III subunit alpha [Deltaproteobacteria bacterium]